MCATPAAPAPGESIETTLRKLLARFTSAVNNRDVEAMVSLYAPDAAVLPPNNSVAIGTKAIRDLFKAMLDAGFSDLTAEATRIEQSGDLAVEVGRYTLQAPQKEGGKKEDRGKYVGTWRRQPNGEYRMIADIWNSDLPLGQ